MNISQIKPFLDSKVEKFNNVSFIPGDPISIPHRFTDRKDIEIIGLWTAILSWGLRKTIINKSVELCKLMDFAPYDFVMNHTDSDLKKIVNFKHRTFNDIDTLCFISFFKWYYSMYNSLEEAFITKNGSIKSGISNFHNIFTSSPDFINRTKKHVSTPLNNSSCKRINMFLRWMVRKDDQGVDFGLWNKIGMEKLMIPLDVHVFRVATHLGLINRNIADWNTVEELTGNLRILDSTDPVKYDYALFSLGVLGKYD